MSTQKQEAVKKLVRAGVKEDFASKVVEQSGYEPSEIIEDTARILEKYWLENAPVEFLVNGTPTNASELKDGLTALGLQDDLVNRAYENAPSSDFIGHRDIYNWGLILIERLADTSSS